MSIAWVGLLQMSFRVTAVPEINVLYNYIWNLSLFPLKLRAKRKKLAPGFLPFLRHVCFTFLNIIVWYARGISKNPLVHLVV